MRAYIRRLLQSAGHHVITAPDGQAALDHLQTLIPDLVLSDVMMPRLDGLRLVRAIRDDPALRELPVILLSARAGGDAQIAGLESAADDYVTKPFAARELLARISANLERRGDRPTHGGPGLLAGVFLTGVYGGYFGAAQGVILIALLAIFVDDDLQRLNGAKNVLALVANLVAGLVFVAVSHVSWSVAGLIALGSVIGGQIGGRVGRRIPDRVLRYVIVGVGLVVAAVLAVEWK